MTIDIYIREKGGTREIRIPLLPEEFSFPSGDVMFISCDIMGRGEVAVPSGVELGRYSWESEFPGVNRKNDAMLRGKWKNPKTYVSILDDWKKNGTMLNLLVTGYPVNVDVYLSEFIPRGTGAFGDISYEITFKEAKSITIKSTKADKNQLPKRQDYKPSHYTIVAGDTLWSIAEKFYGDGKKKSEIYKANKETLESAARLRGMKSSENGHWIFVGVLITLP